MSIEEDIMSEEAFNELIDNFEVVEKITMFGRKSIKYYVKKIQAEREQDKKRIQELEKEKQRYKIAFNQQLEVLKDTVKKLNDSIPTQKVIDKIKEIKEDKDSKYYDKFLHERDIENAIETLQELL